MRLLMMGFDGLGYSPARFTLSDLLGLRTLYAPLPVTGPSWASLYTGLTAKQHKVREAWGRPKDGHHTLGQNAEHLFWNRLKRDLNMRISLCFLPLVKPEFAGADICIEGFPVTNRKGGPATHPKDLKYDGEMLAKTDIMYWPGSNAQPALWAQPLRTRYAVGEMGAKVKEGSFMALDWWMENATDGIDFGFMGFMIPDHPAHVWPWQWADIVLPIIRELIEHALNTLKPDTMMLVSDHGFCMDGVGHTHAGVFGYTGLSFEPPTRANMLHNWSVPGLVFKELGLETELKVKAPRELAARELKHIEHRLRELGYLE